MFLSKESAAKKHIENLENPWFSLVSLVINSGDVTKSEKTVDIQCGYMYVLVSAMFHVPSKFILHSLAYLVEMAVDIKISQCLLFIKTL